MEPGLGGQEKLEVVSAHRLCVSSQWSLALAARKSVTPEGDVGKDHVVAMEPGLGGQEKGSRFFACLTTSIAHLRERWEPWGEAGGLQAAEARSKCVLTRGRALPGGGGGTGALAR